MYANENIPGYTGVPLKKWLEETFSVPAAVLNDVAAAAYALTDTFEDYFFIALGTGVGGAYVHRRQLMNGGTGFGGQIGYLPMKNGSTADQTASSAALARRAGEAGERVFEKAGQGDERAARILDEWLDDVAQVILTAEIVTGAETIVLGGGVSAQGETLLSPLQAKLDRMETPYREKFRLTIAPDGNASGTLGARKYFEESLRKRKMNAFEQVKGGLIVSCQALADEPMFGSEVMAKFALAAKQGGAKGIRANTIPDIRAIKKTVDLPVIGIIKKDYPDSEVYITPTFEEVKALIDEGVDVIALDGTRRSRPAGETLEGLVEKIRAYRKDVLLMADTSTYEEAVYAEKLGFDFAGTTLVSYTPYTKGEPIPALPLIRRLAQDLFIPVIAEGGISTPEELRAALDAGAFAAVVGGAITRPKQITERFVDALEK